MAVEPFAFPVAESQARPPNHGADFHHVVQFYEEEEFLVEAVARYFTEGLVRGGAAVLVGTPDHGNGIRARLSNDFDVAELQREGRFLYIDATELLSSFMRGQNPDEESFERALTLALRKLTPRDGSIAVFGEMVALLHQEGNSGAALQLEAMWNRFATKRKFSLMCGYPLEGFRDSATAELFRQVCQEHSHVVPAESYRRDERDTDERLREVAVLQQRAVSLEKEIAERRRVETELLSHAGTLRILHGVASQLVAETDLSRVISIVTDAAQELCGATSAEFLPRNETDEHESEVAETPLNATPNVLVVPVFARSGALLGNLVLTDSNCDAFLAGHEEPLRTIAAHAGAAIETIQLQLALKAELESVKLAQRAAQAATDEAVQVRLELEQRVQERTQALQEANAEMEAFTYTVSHDLRTPMRGIVASCRMLLEECSDKLSPAEIALLERQEQNTSRLALLVDELLRITRLSRHPIQKECLDISGICREIARDIVPVHQTITITPCIVKQGDPQLIPLVFANLLENAVKFSGGKGEIVVGETDDGAIYVKDQGIGFDMQYADKVMMPFERLHRDEEYPGTGIGLANVSRIVQRHGGRVWPESTPGRGATFFVALP